MDAGIWERADSERLEATSERQVTYGSYSNTLNFVVVTTTDLTATVQALMVGWLISVIEDVGRFRWFISRNICLSVLDDFGQYAAVDPA